MRRLIWVLATVLLGCAFHYYGAFQNVTSFTTRPSLKTPEGIAVAPTSDPLDLTMVDKYTDEVEKCLTTAFPNGVLPNVPAAHCLYNRFAPHIHREAFRVQIAPDWHFGCDGEEQFACNVSPALCAAKGLVVTAECPCECRSTIQDNSTVVTTPNLHMYKAELIRMVTTCNDIWVIPQLSTCAVDENWHGSW